MSLDVSDEDIDAELLDRDIASLRDVQYLYGTIALLERGIGGKYAAYLTPTEAEPLYDEPASVVAADIDLSSGVPEYAGIHTETYRPELTQKVAHSKYSAARGTDHSVTHITGQSNTPEKIGTYVSERLTRWACEDAVTEVAESHPDGGILTALAQLGSDESIVKSIQNDVVSEIVEDKQALTTVRIKRTPTGEWLWPGELDVFNEAMSVLRTARMSSKGEATESKGEAADFVTGELERVVGTVEDPLKYYLTKQMSAFPYLDPDEAWRTNPTTPSSSLRMIQGSKYLDLCSTYAYGASIFTLPYFADMTPEKVRLIHEVFEALDRDTGDKAPLQVMYDYVRENDALGDFRVLVMALVEDKPRPPLLLIDHAMSVESFVPAALATTHERVLDSPFFTGPSALFSLTDDMNEETDYPKYPLAYPWHENIGAAASERLFQSLARGSYFLRTFRSSDKDDGSADDTRVEATLAAFGGDPLQVETLFREFSRRLVDEEDPGAYFPWQMVSQQFAQYAALADCGLLAGPADVTQLSLTDMTDTLDAVEPDDESNAVHRRRALEAFLKAHPALEDDERRAIFLLGALVGHVDYYQRVAEEREQTVLSMHPIKSLTKANVKRIFATVLDKNLTYSRAADDNNTGMTMYSEVVTKLPDALAGREATEWDISLEDMRFHYALGIAYAKGPGRRYSSDDTDTATEADPMDAQTPN